MAIATPIADFTNAVEKAIRNGTKAHIDHEVLRAVVESPAYAMLLEQRRQEFIESWENREEPTPKPKGSKSENIGSNGAPSASSGASPGTIPPLVHDAAAARALEAASQIIHRKKPGERSPRTISSPTSRQSPKPRQKHRSRT